MKKYKYLAFLLLSIAFLPSCGKDDNNMTPGNPVLESKTEFAGASFGDNLSFTMSVKDNVPLSTLTAKLYFGEEKVSETVIRTKANGDYSGTIFVPYYKNIPDGIATLEFILMDTHLSSVKKSYDLPVSRPNYPYLILVTPQASYPMLPTATPYEYVATEAFPSTDLSAYIKTPATGAGNEITFGWDAGEINQGTVAEIPFSSAQGGTYSVTFNTKTYEAAPFFELTINGQKMAMKDKENFTIDLDLTQGQELTVEGIGNIADWWIDPDFFNKVSDNKFTFVPITGKYRITANTARKYFQVEVLSGNTVATLQADGSGAIWVIGEGVGKPAVATNEVGWTTEKGLCLAPIGGKKYQISFVANETVKANSINFKFFHQKGWGGEFGSSEVLSTTSNIIKVGATDGNLSLIEGKTLTTGKTYVFTVDVSAGNSAAVLTVIEK